MTDHARLQKLARAVRELRLRDERALYEDDFGEFVRGAWPSIEAVPFQESWAIDALCDHLQAVTEGHIRKLLVNFPPRCGKTDITSIMWPTWTWAREEKTFTSGPSVRFLCGSYGHELALQNSNSGRRLLLSPWFQARWGKRFSLRADQNTKGRFENTSGGARIATSVGGSLLGIGGDVIIIDDPHNTEQVESEAERETVQRWWSEISSTRLNDPQKSALVVIMQRLHVDDVSGLIQQMRDKLEDDEDDWVHLMIPMRHDVSRHCVTMWTDLRRGQNVVWEDPRTEAGELMWEERFPSSAVAHIERELGPYMASGRLQQDPVPAGGGIIKSEWWQLWESGKHWPVFDYIVASLDTAYTEDEENDPSGMTVWGVFNDEHGRRRVMLVSAWEERLELHDLVTKVAKTCRDLQVDRLLIEAKASGLSVAQEIRRLYSRELWAVETINPKSMDKVARVHAIVPLFSDGVIWAPDFSWAQMVINQCRDFPKGKHDDLVDTVSQALGYLRSIGLAEIGAEIQAQFEDARRYRSPGMKNMPYVA